MRQRSTCAAATSDAPIDRFSNGLDGGGPRRAPFAQGSASRPPREPVSQAFSNLSAPLQEPFSRDAQCLLERISRGGTLGPHHAEGSDRECRATEDAWFASIGSSMEPALRHGDRLIIDRDLQPGIGDIAVFDMAGKTVVHRIVTTHPLRQMGDALSRGSKLSEASIIGVGVIAVRDGRGLDLRSPAARRNGRRQAARAVTRHVRRRVRDSGQRLSHKSHEQVSIPIQERRQQMTRTTTPRRRLARVVQTVVVLAVASAALALAPFDPAGADHDGSAPWEIEAEGRGTAVHLAVPVVDPDASPSPLGRATVEAGKAATSVDSTGLEGGSSALVADATGAPIEAISTTGIDAAGAVAETSAPPNDSHDAALAAFDAGRTRHHRDPRFVIRRHRKSSSGWERCQHPGAAAAAAQLGS